MTILNGFTFSIKRNYTNMLNLKYINFNIRSLDSQKKIIKLTRNLNVLITFFKYVNQNDMFMIQTMNDTWYKPKGIPYDVNY